MDQGQDRMLAGLVTAMKAEAEGHHFYRMAAVTTADPQGKEVFERLAQEEIEHLDFLKVQHQALLSSGRVDASVSLGKPSTWDGASPIFSPALRDRIGEAHFEMTALSVGIQLELSAEQFYGQVAAEASNEDVRRFYQELAQWEAGHYRVLLRQQELLKESYWSASGFAPM